MKKDIHPAYHQVNVTCACGNSFVVNTTTSKLSVDICNECHPFYTGKQKLLDTAGRVEKFMRKYGRDKKEN
jgi:large subunit ribosomal protein L31